MLRIFLSSHVSEYYIPYYTLIGDPGTGGKAAGRPLPRGLALR